MEMARMEMARMEMARDVSVDPMAAPGSEQLSYKFQRLRERLRQAISSGELSGKLPGERELARTFRANPKTLGKALTDLAAEGLLERSIGRGTYVKGTAAQPAQAGPWLVFADGSAENALLVDALRQQNPAIESASPAARLRPSYLDHFGGVIDLSASMPESLLRSLIVRGMSIVRVGREPTVFQTHAVLLDVVQAANVLTRRLLLAGHRHILVVDTTAQQTMAGAVRLAVQRYAPSATVAVETACSHGRVLESGATAVLCDSEATARHLCRSAVDSIQFARLSVAAIGLCDGEPCCTGVYVKPAELAAAAMELIGDVSLRRPVTLWLTGQTIDCDTVRAVPEPVFAAEAA